MSVLAADLTSPKGELQTTWFADLSGSLAIWIPLGEAQAPVGATTAQADRITTAYAYWRAYSAKAAEMAGTPNKQNTAGVEFNEEYTKEQRAWFDGKAAEWLAEFNAAVSDATPSTVTVIDNAPRASFAQPIARSF